MEEKDKGGEGGEGEGNQPELDAFGQPLKEPKPQEKPNPEAKKEGEDITKHPIVVDLQTKLGEATKKLEEYGNNFSGQSKVIKDLQKQLKNLLKGGKDGKPAEQAGNEPRFKEIKRSKDLTVEQKDEMTETELKQMDVIADLMEAVNATEVKLNQNTKKDEDEDEDDEDEGADDVPENPGKVVKDTAKELAKAASGKPNTELANKIIASFNGLGFKVEGLSEEEIQKRVALAAGQVSEYKPPKEQNNKRGGAVKETEGDDPFGVDKIVEEVASRNNTGSYAL